MANPKLFVSFSSHDKDFIGKLFCRLEAQPVELWDYSREGQEIPGGSNVMDYLRKRINRSDVFIPVISPRSFKSNYAQNELRHALEFVPASKLRIIPLILADCPNKQEWPEPYQSVARIRGYKVQENSVTKQTNRGSVSFEEAVRRICLDLNVQYLPLPFEDPRLPFMVKFEAEMKKAQARGRAFRHAERDIAIFQRLMDARIEAGEALKAGRYDLALTRINFFIATCEYELPDERFYYPYVVKAICLTCTGQLLAATNVLLELKNHPALDENVFGALGYIKHEQGAFQEALAYYQEAAKLDPNDPAAKYGMLLNVLQSDASNVEVDRLLQEIESGNIPASEDRIKIEVIKAYAYARTGRISQAITVYEKLLRDGHDTASILVNFAAALETRPQQALALLEHWETRFGDDADFLHRLASLSFQLNQMDRAAKYFRRLVELHPGRRQFRIDAAQVFWQTGDRAGARQMASTILDRRLFSVPVTTNDFFCDGFANWMLNRPDRAEYDFERCGLPSKSHYRNLLPS